tara:strand:- start:10 stop:501 length:492 start_codon:yes stop_codon:yes gene_type:complete
MNTILKKFVNIVKIYWKYIMLLILASLAILQYKKKELFTQDGDDQKDTPSGSEINKNPDIWSLELEYHALKMKEILNKVLDGDYTGSEAGKEFTTELDNAISLKGKYEGPAQGSMYYSESPDITNPEGVANLASQIVVQTSELLRMILNPANRPINEKSILAA